MKELKAGKVAKPKKEEPMKELKEVVFKTLEHDLFDAPESTPSPNTLTRGAFKPGMFNYMPNMAAARVLMLCKAGLAIWKYFKKDMSMVSYTDIMNEAIFRLAQDIAPDIVTDDVSILDDATATAMEERIRDWLAILMDSAPADTRMGVINIEYTLNKDLGNLEVKWQKALAMVEQE